MASIAQNLKRVKKRIRESANKVGRNPKAITLVRVGSAIFN